MRPVLSVAPASERGGRGYPRAVGRIASGVMVSIGVIDIGYSLIRYGQDPALDTHPAWSAMVSKAVAARAAATRMWFHAVHFVTYSSQRSVASSASPIDSTSTSRLCI